MNARRNFLKQTLILGAAGLYAATLAGCSTAPAHLALAKPSRPLPGNGSVGEEPAALDLFDARLLDADFWQKPRTIELYRPDCHEHLKVLYWKDGEMNHSAYEQLCHIMRDVHARKMRPIDPKLIETLWATQAFVSRYGLTDPIELLSGYRTRATNRHLRETGVPAARKSLHMVGKAADIRIAGLTIDVLGSLIKSFQVGGVGFYHRASVKGGWIHTDTGLQRTWLG